MYLASKIRILAFSFIMHKKSNSIAESVVSLNKSPIKSQRLSIIAVQSPQICYNKVLPSDISHATKQTPRIYLKNNQTSPLILHIQRSGFIKHTKSYRFQAGDQLKEIASSMKFPCEYSDVPYVSKFNCEDSAPNDSAESSISIGSLNQTLDPLKPMSPSICRICLDCNKPEDLISPCKCKGSLQYVHQGCLKL